MQAYFRHRRRLKAQALRSEGHADAVAKKEAELQALTKQFTESTEAIKSLHTATLIRGWVSNEEAAAARRAASHGYLRDLRAIKAERTEWQNASKQYLVMMSWDLTDSAGNTALMHAVANDHPDCVEFLLDQGADPNIPNDHGDSPLHAAKSRAVAKLLLDRGANPAAIDAEERTPFELHRGKRFDDMMKGLAAHNDKGNHAHMAFGRHQQLRVKRTKKVGKLSAEERAKAQKLADEALIAHQAQLDKEAHDALVAAAEICYNRGVGALKMMLTNDAVDAFAECLAFFPHHDNALSELRRLASAMNAFADVRTTAQAALRKLIYPDAKDETPIHGRDQGVLGEAELLCEARATYESVCFVSTGKKSSEDGLTFSQLSNALGDFGLDAESVQHLLLLVDNDANDRVTMDEFYAGFIRFRQSGLGVLGYTSVVKLKGLSHHVQDVVREAKYEQTLQLRQEAIAAANHETRESFEGMRELDVLHIGGIPSSFFAGLDSQAADDAVGNLARQFGFVMASTAKVVDKAFAGGCGKLAICRCGRSCQLIVHMHACTHPLSAQPFVRMSTGSSGLAKFAMTASVVEAIDQGLSLTDGDGITHQLILKHGPTDDVFDRINLRHLDLIARGLEEHAAAYRAESLKHHEELGKRLREREGHHHTLKGVA